GLAGTAAPPTGGGDHRCRTGSRDPPNAGAEHPGRHGTAPGYKRHGADHRPACSGLAGTSLCCRDDHAMRAALAGAADRSGGARDQRRRRVRPRLAPVGHMFALSVGSANTKGTVSNADDELSTFSSSDDVLPIDVVAPGEGIVSL